MKISLTDMLGKLFRQIKRKVARMPSYLTSFSTIMMSSVLIAYGIYISATISRCFYEANEYKNDTAWVNAADPDDVIVLHDNSIEMDGAEYPCEIKRNYEMSIEKENYTVHYKIGISNGNQVLRLFYSNQGKYVEYKRIE